MNASGPKVEQLDNHLYAITNGECVPLETRDTLTGYNVYEVSGGTYSFVAGLDASTTDFVVTGLTNGVEYTYVVSSVLMEIMSQDILIKLQLLQWKQLF
jgi:hypothetical protein